ncbi:MAG TPA: NmrA family NAD(P)-binding protein [Myxococcaceae bacterium]|nr:NmrA family NAD(P)-binding protein [Myxococcaceae bacterium]
MVVVLSQWLSDVDHPALHAREKWLSSRVFDRAPVDVVTVAPGWFADNDLAALEPIAQLGLFAMPLGEGLNAPPSNEDIGRVVAGVLADPARHLGRTHRPTGPSLLSPSEIAGAFARVLGRPVRYRSASLGLFLKVARSLGLSDFVLSQLRARLALDSPRWRSTHAPESPRPAPAAPEAARPQQTTAEIPSTPSLST